MKYRHNVTSATAPNSVAFEIECNVRAGRFSRSTFRSSCHVRQLTGEQGKCTHKATQRFRHFVCNRKKKKKMENHEIELEDDFETASGFHTPISCSSSDCERRHCDSDARNAGDGVHSIIDIESISIALDNSPSTSTCSDDHTTKRNILSMQKEEAFQDWLDAKKFVYTHSKRQHSEPIKKKTFHFIFRHCLEYRTN